MNTQKTAPDMQNKQRRVSVLALSPRNARKYFLQADSYCNFDLPPYINFDKVIKDVNSFFQQSRSFNLRKNKNSPRDYNDVNHIILNNKDGRYAWRPLELIHPVLYVFLVRIITEKKNWGFIRERFEQFSKNTKIRCLSIPVQSQSYEKNKAEQILQWWEEIEQRSIECALKYSYMLESDITDCYGAIYTHSISWALHGKDVAKKNRRNNKFVGNKIDSHIQDMSFGQTNGIPQGSVLMDFIAEMVLGYADMLLSERIAKDTEIKDYFILRYRDDCRIYVNNLTDGEIILKLLTEVMTSLNLKLNSSKIKANTNIIQASLKADKIAWLNRKQSIDSVYMQKHLFAIHHHSISYPNGGSLMILLQEFYKKIEKVEDDNKETEMKNVIQLISITVDIAYNNPRTYAVCFAIISKLLDCLKCDKTIIDTIQDIQSKFSILPNTGHMELWLQRISHPYAVNMPYKELLCKLIAKKTTENIWNIDWITSKKLKNAVLAKDIIDDEKIINLSPIMSIDEIKLFQY